MSAFALPILYAALLWWGSTGVILWLIGRPKRTYGATMIAASFLFGAASVGLVAFGEDASVGGAFIGFTLGVIIWGWHETAFLTGAVTGPRREDCPAGLSGWRRFGAATETVIHHEFAIAITAMILTMMTWNAPNQIGVWTFLLLWGMRLSAKANIFAGVPNLTDEFLPAHLAHLKTCFGPKRLGAFFFVSTGAATLVAALIARAAAVAPEASVEQAGLALIATLAALAVIEHLFMALPIRDAALWAWARRDAARSDFSNETPARPASGPASGRH